MKSSNLLYSLYSWQSRVTSPLSTKSCCKDWLPRNLKTRMLLVTWSKSKKREFFSSTSSCLFHMALSSLSAMYKAEKEYIVMLSKFYEIPAWTWKGILLGQENNPYWQYVLKVYVKLCQGIYSEICKDLTWFLWIAFFCFISCNCSYFCELHFSLSSDL